MKEYTKNGLRTLGFTEIVSIILIIYLTSQDMITGEQGYNLLIRFLMYILGTQLLIVLPIFLIATVGAYLIMHAQMEK